MEMGLSLLSTLSNPTLKSVFKGENGQIGYSVVNVLVNRFITSFGFSTKMDKVQIETLTVDTLDRFAYESLEDVILFFKMARNGQFGTTNRGVDSNLIFGDWFVKYLEMKADLREQEYQKEKSRMNGISSTFEDVEKTYQANEKIKFEKSVLDYIDKITDGISRIRLEEIIEEWEKDEQKKPYIRQLKRKRLTIKS